MSYVLADRAQALIQQLQMLFPGAYIYTVNVIGSASVPPSNTVGAPLPVQFNYSVGANNFQNLQLINIPATQVWYIVDMYTTSSPSVDGYVVFYKNGTKILLSSPDLASMIVSNPARTHLPSILKYEANTTLSAQFVPLQQNTGSSAVTVNFFIEVVVVDFSYISAAY